MIPREILKKIRQIEIRTNRVVRISSPVFQLFRFAARVEDGQNHNALFFDEKVNYERKAADNGSANLASDFRKSVRVFRDAFMIPREILKKIRQIEIRTNRVVTETLAGQYHSVFKGQGMNFDEVREYQPGDDVRAIDWNVTARMNHPFIKNSSRNAN
jgi:hypothetical protein